ncbi:MAG TPA: AI-2E family transporter [Candidatus Nanoarchaeia archaeon]|nr:AI-2E family transporter [Candidatus Nanoarchaeia archaeon]
MGDYKKYFHGRNLILIGIIIIAIIGIFVIRPYIIYLVSALILTFITYPIYSWLAKKLKNQNIAALIMVISLFLIIIIPSVFFVIKLVDETAVILSTGTLLDVDRELEEELGVKSFLDTDESKEFLIKAREKILSGTLSLISKVSDILIGFFIMLFTMFYLFREWPAVQKLISKLIPLEPVHRAYLLGQLRMSIKGILLGQVLTAFIQGLAGGLGFLVFGVDNVVFWTFLMIILSMIPMLGPYLVWIPATILLYLNGHVGKAIGLAIYSILVVSNIDNFVRPKLIGSKIGVHPVFVLIGVLGGLAAFGLIGILLGPLIFAIFLSLLKCYAEAR